VSRSLTTTCTHEHHPKRGRTYGLFDVTELLELGPQRAVVRVPREAADFISRIGLLVCHSPDEDFRHDERRGAMRGTMRRDGSGGARGIK
jgi:hypothetical protein